MPPTLNSIGEYSHGVGGGALNLNNAVLLPAGANLGWMDDDRIAFASGVDTLPGDEWTASIYHVSSGLTERLNPATPSAANFGFAGGGHAAWWWGSTTSPYRRLNSTTGFRSTLAGLLGMGPEAEIGFKPDYNASGPSKVRDLNGTIWTLSANTAFDLCLLGQHRAVWIEPATGLHVVGTPVPLTLPGGVHFPYAFPINGEWWLGYYSDGSGLVAHPFASLTPLYTFVPAGGDAWPAFRALTNNSFRVVWSDTQGEQAGNMTAQTVTIGSVSDGPIIDPPPGPGGGGTGGNGGGGTIIPVRVNPTPHTPGRRYPHVDGITDWRAQQSVRLLWDQTADLGTRLDAAHVTLTDLAANAATQDDIAKLRVAVGEALAIAQQVAGRTSADGAPLTGPGSKGEPIVPMSADPVVCEDQIKRSLAYYGRKDYNYWAITIHMPGPWQGGDKKYYMGWDAYMEQRAAPGDTGSADHALLPLPAVHQDPVPPGYPPGGWT